MQLKSKIGLQRNFINLGFIESYHIIDNKTKIRGDKVNEETRNTLSRCVREFALNYRGNIQNWNEVDVERYFIDPLLNSLRWNTADHNLVRYQYPVTMGSDTKKADYVLLSEGAPICVIEAKAGEFDESAVRQAMSYALNLRIKWAIVTNGQKLCLYGVHFSTSENVKNALVMDIEFSPDKINDSLDSILDSLEYLARGKLETDGVSDVFKSLNERQALLAFLQSNKNILVKDVITQWIEEQWDKGPVDESVLLGSLESIFGRIERIESTPPARAVPTNNITVTTAGDWDHRPDLGSGIFELMRDQTKRIDVSLGGREMKRKLEELGLRLSTTGAFGGFRYTLRDRAGLINR